MFGNEIHDLRFVCKGSASRAQCKKSLVCFIAETQPIFVYLEQSYSFISNLLTQILPNDDFVLQTAICNVKPETII